jgi:hypothetical protein
MQSFKIEHRESLARYTASMDVFIKKQWMAEQRPEKPLSLAEMLLAH